ITNAVSPSPLYRCKKWGIPIEKIYNKTQREKFAWAIDMADNDYQF
ncbi:DNA topoisomerase 1, partial [Silurus meridionalis]